MQLFLNSEKQIERLAIDASKTIMSERFLRSYTDFKDTHDFVNAFLARKDINSFTREHTIFLNAKEFIIIAATREEN